jgi:hypothetical protein
MASLFCILKGPVETTLGICCIQRTKNNIKEWTNFNESFKGDNMKYIQCSSHGNVTIVEMRELMFTIEPEPLTVFASEHDKKLL